MTNPPNDPAGYGSGGVSDVGDLPPIHTSPGHAPRKIDVPPTPELDKQSAIIRSGKAAVVQDFYDWLHEEKKWVLARYVPEDERRGNDGIYGEQPVPVFISPEQLMADFFGIDRDKIERERRALLDMLREQQ